jgi:hypothetical protein
LAKQFSLVFLFTLGILKRAHIAKPLYPVPTHDNGWQCIDGMIEPKWVSGDFLPKQLADVLVEENIAGYSFQMFSQTVSAWRQ